MTFDKYKEGREKFNDCIFPKDGYDYEYVWTKRIGWYIKRGKKLSELPKQKWNKEGK